MNPLPALPSVRAQLKSENRGEENQKLLAQPKQHSTLTKDLAV